jgi:hypothetical protein
MAGTAGTALRALGQEFGVVKAMSVLFKERTQIPIDKIRSYLGNASALTALKTISERPDLNINQIKAVFRLADTYGATRKNSLDAYFKFIFQTLEPAARLDMVNELSTGDDVQEVYDVMDLLLAHQTVPQNMDSLNIPTAPAAMPLMNEPLPVDLEPLQPRQVTEQPPEESISVGSASTASSSLIDSDSLASSALIGDLTASTGLTASTASKKVTRKVRARPAASVATTESDEVSFMTTTTKVSSEPEDDVKFKVGFKIHVKSEGLNFDKYDTTMLDKRHNEHAKLLVVDIDSCTDIIYPVAVDLPPGSLNKDVLVNIVKVLTEASSKNLRCHTTYHVYAVKAWNSTERVTYVNVHVPK